MASKSNWQRMGLEDRLKAASIDIMRHPDFALMSGVICMGKVVVEDELPTAGTDGLDVYYGREFMMSLSVEQVRWVVLHENFHKAYKHCTHYTDLVEKYGMLANVAQDYTINGDIYQMDPSESFAKRPDLPICFNEKYFGMSWIEVLRDLLKNAKPQGGKGGKKGNGGSGAGTSFDNHMPGGTAAGKTPKEVEEMSRAVDDALAHGRIIAQKMAGKGKGNAVLDGIMHERRTDWRRPLRQFVETICVGDDQSRFCPPNKRLLPLGFIMPSHFSYSTGELIIACDTSGSMTGVYPVVFGEIANICLTVKPDRVRVIWWDDGVNDEQVFEAKDFQHMSQMQFGSKLKPKGGGGTRVSCVAEYIEEKKYKPKGVVLLTDGYIESSYTLPHAPTLWGVVDHEAFVPTQGTVVHINSLSVGN